MDVTTGEDWLESGDETKVQEVSNLNSEAFNRSTADKHKKCCLEGGINWMQNQNQIGQEETLREKSQEYPEGLTTGELIMRSKLDKQCLRCLEGILVERVNGLREGKGKVTEFLFSCYEANGIQLSLHSACPTLVSLPHLIWSISTWLSNI